MATRVVVGADVPVPVHDDHVREAGVVGADVVPWLLKAQLVGSQDPALFKKSALLQVENVLVPVPFSIDKGMSARAAESG